MLCPSFLWLAAASDRWAGWSPGVVSINDCRYINSVKERYFGGYFQPLSLLQLSSSLKPLKLECWNTVFPYPRVVHQSILSLAVILLFWYLFMLLWYISTHVTEYSFYFGEIDKARLLSYEQNFSRISNLSSTNIWKLKKKRLEDAWFMLHLVQLYTGAWDKTCTLHQTRQT